MPATSTVVPRRIIALTTRGFCVSFAGQVVIAIGQAFHLWGHDRPTLAMMVFGLFMSASIVFGVAAILARCHMTVAQAFTAGMLAGRSAPQSVRGPGAGLRVVE